jgi:hypothetical protein
VVFTSSANLASTSNMTVVQDSDEVAKKRSDETKPDEMRAVCATFELTKQGVLTTLGQVTTTDKVKFIEMRPRGNKSREQTECDMYIMDDQGCMIARDLCKLSELANGERDLIATVSDVRKMPDGKHEVMYDEVAVYKPVCQDPSFAAAKAEIKRMIEEKRSSQELDQAMPDLLLYYSAVPSGISSEALNFVWRPLRIEDFNEDVFELGGFVFERMFFRNKRLAVKKQVNTPRSSICSSALLLDMPQMNFKSNHI